MDLNPKSSPSNSKKTSRGYQVIPINDHEVVTTEEHFYNEKEEIASLVGGGSSTRSPRHHLSRASSLASSSDQEINDNNNDQQQQDNDNENGHDEVDAFDEEDDFNLRRYHNFVRPAPMEYDGGGDGFLMHHWNELRQAAHQRRAARLLSMPNPESTINQATVCFVSTCCDATDAGIVVAAIGILLWVAIGVLLELKSLRYWCIGSFVVMLRFTGRRLMEMFLLRRRRLSEEPGASSRFKHSNHGRLPPPII